LWHGAIYYLEPHWFISRSLSGAGEAASFPFFSTAAPSVPYLVFVGCWFALVLAIGVLTFERKEL
jgi:hypothetical protein